MTIDNVRLPIHIERGASGGPMFRTTVVPLDSGHEQRNRHWKNPRRKYDISYGITEGADLEAIIIFFHARGGMARGFLFRDLSDYTVENEFFGTGDGTKTEFQLIKTYTSGGVSHVRNITRPVDPVDSITSTGPVPASTVDYETGIVTFASPPASGSNLYWSGKFDVPVRFDIDQLNVTIQMIEQGTVPAISLIELR